jgi:nitronate monooxygenase
MATDKFPRLLDRLGVSVPIVQAPMAGVSSPAMAAAVSESGGLGSLGVGAMNAAKAREAIHQFRKESSAALNVNVFVHQPARANRQKEAAWLERLRPQFARLNAAPPDALHEIYTSFLGDADMLAMLVEEKPQAVSFHFGLPLRSQIEALHNAGIVLLATATNLDEAKAIEAAGIDAIIAQGYEAGGHRGMFDPDVEDSRLGTLALTRVLVQNIDLPVIAAGGIMDGAGIAAALSLGASAAQLGTAFIATDESLADAGYRERLFSDAAYHTIMTRAISGRPARSLANEFTRLGTTVSDDSIPDYPIAYDAGKSLHAVGKAVGQTGYGAQWAGQGAPLARALPTRILMQTLKNELDQALSQVAAK